MINLSLVLENPWSAYNWRSIWSMHKTLAKHKHLEIELSRYSQELFGIRLELNWRGRDHAGPRIELICATYVLCVHIYDNRHWNWDNSCWEVYNEEDTCQNLEAESPKTGQQ